MKKIIALALALIMMVGALFTFSACGENDQLNFGAEYTPLAAQMDVLLQLNTKSVDVGVMDSIMAGYYMSQDSTYSDKLMIVDGLTLSTEQYGIAARKGSGLIKKINQALIDLAKAGEIDTLADKYGIKSELCIDTTKKIDALTADEQKDWNYIVENGEFIVGYTIFAPIAYKENDKLIGFDIELAEAVAEKLELNVKFELIEWSAKEAKLESKAIDCIWNGMTINEERLAAMEISIPYLNNKQVAVIRKEDKDLYKTTEDMADAIVAAEEGSAGESCIVKADEE